MKEMTRLKTVIDRRGGGRYTTYEEKERQMPESIQTLKRRYRGEWLAIKVTKRGKHHEPLAGELVSHASSHRTLHRRLTDPEVYETYAGRLPTQAVLY